MAEKRGVYPPPTPTTPRLAPWDHVELLCHKLDRLITLMEAWAPAAPPEIPTPPELVPITSRLDEIKEQLQTLKDIIAWRAKDTEEIYRRAIRAAGTFYTQKLVNWTKGKRLLLRVESSLDQDVDIQALGNIRPSLDGAVDINDLFTCGAGSKITIGFAWDDWHPYIGAEITVAIAPTTGQLMIEAVVQE